ncbi:MAG: hypothetical protein CVV58_05610 [Tenericutes bacterium HGW-Tenericutes-3]|nr:MAG: hypothetical protein CVV58_05610 [Tenericutes bacterium HGW-Tenericutes-3]
MKRRIVISGSLTILILILIPVALILFNLKGQGVFMLSSIVTLVYVGVYVFGGVPKLIIYAIYGLITTLFLFLLAQPYHLPIVIVGTLLFVLNPLSSFELYLENHLNDEDVLPVRFSIRGSYWPFFSYQREMKNFYHLPQARKLYTKKWYLHLRQLTTLFLFSLGVFLFIHSLNSIANSLDDFNWLNFFVFYVIIVVFVMALFMFKKGFTSTFRLFVISLFPPVIYLFLVSDFPDAIRYSFAGSFVIIGVVVSVIEFVRLYQRVAYDSYHYYDVDQQMEVYANALFEPLVYNESFTQCGEYSIKVSLEAFQKQFHDILVYANYFKFIITAYSYKKNTVYLYADFHEKNVKRSEKFKTYLELKFKMSVALSLQHDPNKEIYENNFFHQPDYIISRAQNLAGLLKELEIKTKIIVSFIVYFELEDELEAFSEDYAITELDDLSDEAYLTVRVDIPCINVDYVIESKIRELLLSLLINHGKFVRVSVYY